MTTRDQESIVVTFDGRYLSYEQDGQLVRIPAISGNPANQNPGTDQSIPNRGLIPVGTYNVRQSEYQNRDIEGVSWLEDIA